MTTGQRGEEIAADYLRSKGYRLLTQNFRAGRFGELDLVCQKDQTLVFIEVKTRVSETVGEGVEAVRPWKIRHLKKAAEVFIRRSENLPPLYRFDVLSLLLDPQTLKPQRIDHFQNITQ